MSDDVFIVNEEISRLLESDNSNTRSLGEWFQSLSIHPTMEDRGQFNRRRITSQVDDFEKRFADIVTSHGEVFNEFHGVHDELISFSLKDLNKIISRTLLNTRFFLDVPEEELVISVSSGDFQSYTYKALIHSVKLGEKYLDSESPEKIDYTPFDKTIYLFTNERINIIEFLHDVAWYKYPQPIPEKFFTQPFFSVTHKQIKEILITLQSEKIPDFKHFLSCFLSPDRIHLFSLLLNYLNTGTEISNFADKLIRQKFKENIKPIQILCHLVFPTSEELEKKRQQMSRELRIKKKVERDRVIENFRKNSKGIVSKCFDDGVLRELLPEEYSTEDQELMSKIHLFTSSNQADVIWIKSKTPKFKNQLIIVSDSFTFKALTRGSREFLTSELTPDSLRGKRVSNLVPTPLFKSKYDVSVVKFSDNLDEFITNVFSPARIEQYNIEEETGNTIVRVTVSHREMGRAIGRNLINLIRAQILLRTYFSINDVKVQKNIY